MYRGIPLPMRNSATALLNVLQLLLHGGGRAPGVKGASYDFMQPGRKQRHGGESGTGNTCTDRYDLIRNDVNQSFRPPQQRPRKLGQSSGRKSTALQSSQTQQRDAT